MNASTQALAIDMTKELNPEVIIWGIENRPWGHFERLANQDKFQVKRLVVSPGKTLPLQKHSHRAAHWIIVKGVAEVVRGDKHLVLHPNQSVYIPICELRRLHNPGSMPLEVIEIQTGSYLGKENIVMHENNYGRRERNES